MNLQTMIKREIAINTLTITFVVLGLFAFSYALFFDIEEGGTNVISFGNIDMSFCANATDANCTDVVENVGNIIGTEEVSGVSTPVEVYPMSDTDGLATTPYKFVLKNTGDYDLYVSIKLEPDNTFSLGTEFPSYNSFTETAYSNIRVAFGESGLTPTVRSYNSLTDYIIAEDVFLESGTRKVFDLRAWVSSSAPNTAQGTYFVTAISAIGEFIPETT